MFFSHSFHTYSLQALQSKYAHITPTQWGEGLQGITTFLPNDTKPTIYLTFDVCDGDYDKALSDYLITQQIPATLFINSRWIDKHPSEFLALSHNPLFLYKITAQDISHSSVNCRSIYNIKDTKINLKTILLQGLKKLCLCLLKRFYFW